MLPPRHGSVNHQEGPRGACATVRGEIGAIPSSRIRRDLPRRQIPPPGGSMRDPRTRQLAKLIVNHSCELRQGEAVLIESFDLADGLVLDLVEETQAVGAIPVVSLRDNAVIRTQLRGANRRQLELQAAIELQQMQQVQAYVGIRASTNVSELADVPSDQMSLYQQIVAKPVHLDYRVNHTRWVVLRYPNSAMAQLADMSTEAFEDFYFRVCNVD